MPISSQAASRLMLAILLTTVVPGFAAGPLAETHTEPLRRGLGPEPDSLHIHQAQGLAAFNLLRDLREGLITFDAAGELAPGVAQEWQVLDSGRRYVFTLRTDARWSNGDAVTAEDFVRAWRQAFSPGAQAVTAGLLKDVLHAEAILRGERPVSDLGIQALAKDKLEIALTQAAPWLLEILAHPVSFPLHKSMTGAGASAQDPVNGAYLLGEWIPRSVIRLRRNPAFHGASEVALESIEYFPIEEPATELARYRAGELDISETIPAGRFAWLKENLAADLRISPYLGSFWLGLNMQHAALGKSRELRHALALAIDRETLVRVALGAGELQSYGLVPPGMSGYQSQSMDMAGVSQAEREQKAKELLAAAGYGPKRPLLLELRYNTSGLHRRIAVTVAAMWKQTLGVNTELINEEWKVFVNNRRLGVVTQVFRGGWIADFADPSSFLDLFITGNELNTTFHADPEFDALLSKASAMDGAARMEVLQQAEARLLDTLPVIPLYFYVSRHLVNPDVRGFVDNARDVHLSRYMSKEIR